MLTPAPWKMEKCGCGRCDTYFINVTQSDGRLSKENAEFIIGARQAFDGCEELAGKVQVSDLVKNLTNARDVISTTLDYQEGSFADNLMKSIDAILAKLGDSNA